ncbi:MAG: acetylornithine deacetylase [Gammaproteobacteria bacterium]|nr:acetylornithine deacetylase [Gammaproteobacteria bacterium]
MPRHIPKLLQMIRELIEAPSVSATDPALDMGNRAVVERLAGWAEDLGFHVSLTPVDEAKGKYNLVASMGPPGDGLVLAGHADTVPYDQTRWRHDPFKLTEANGKLYGLGTSDMKSFLALAVEAARDMPLGKLRKPLVILATADEETGMSGAKALAASGRAPGRYAVIGEPTGLRPVRMHKGIMMHAVRIQGRSGHSSDPSLGVSALEAMHRVIAALLAWRDEIQGAHWNGLFSVPFPTLNLGHIHGGDNPNRICGDCELQLDLRPLPGMSLQMLRDTLHERVQAAVAGDDVSVQFEALFDGIPAMETAADSAVVHVAETLTGRTAEAVAFATEAPYFGQLGMETIVLGPGDIAQAHQPDEYLSMDRLQPTVQLLRKLIQRFCLT